MATSSVAEFGAREHLPAMAAAWSRSRRIGVGAFDIRYREAGSGPAIALIHGLGVSADYWVRNGPPIAAAGFRVLALDLPGFGRTRGPAAGLPIGEQAVAVIGWLEALGVDRAILLGHSLSCQTVVEVARRRPGLVHGLVLAAPTGDSVGGRRLARQLVSFALNVPRESFHFAALVLQAYFQAGPRRVFGTWRDGARHDPLALLPDPAPPTLVIVGARDPVVEMAFAHRLASGMGDAPVAIVPGAAHGLIHEPTGTFNGLVVEFGRRVG